MNLGNSLRTALAEIVNFLPSLLAAIVILIVGFLVAKLLAKATDALLERLRFDQAVSRGGVDVALQRTGSKLDPSSLIAGLVFWIVLLVATLMAANALGLTAVAVMFQQLVAYIPNVIVAVLIITVGMVVGTFVEEIVGASVGGMGGGITLAKFAKVAVIALAVFMALDQLKVAPNIISTAFTLLLGAVAVAVALAFGLGNRELAGEYTRRWVNAGAEKADQMKQGARHTNSSGVSRRPARIEAE